MDKAPASAPAKADKKNEKLTGWLGTYAALTALGAMWTIINLFRNNFDVLGDCGGKASSILKKFCADVTPPIIAEIVVGFILAAIANAVLGPWAAKTGMNVTGRLVASLVIAVVQAGIWIPFFIFSKKAKQELNQ